MKTNILSIRSGTSAKHGKIQRLWPPNDVHLCMVQVYFCNSFLSDFILSRDLSKDFGWYFPGEKKVCVILAAEEWDPEQGVCLPVN